MKDTGLRMWLAAFVITTVASSSIALHKANERTYYKGLEPIAALTADASRMPKKVARTPSAPTRTFGSVVEANSQRLAKILDEGGAASSASILTTAPSTSPPPAAGPKQPLATRCPADETPVITNGSFTGCKSNKEKIPAAKIIRGPAPKISYGQVKRLKPTPTVAPAVTPTAPPKITIPKVESSTCNSESKFMYTGPDRPGLLYGMCIECDTETFTSNGYLCPAPK